MTWDVPTEFDCPSCGQTMFKKSGRGAKKPFCINEACENFLPEDQRGGYRKKTAAAEETPDGAAETAAQKPAAKKTAAAKKPAAKRRRPLRSLP